jgi:hypothetical protein
MWEEEKEREYYKTNSRFIYSLPCSPLILETKRKGSHPCYFEVVVGFCYFLCYVFSSPKKKINKNNKS